jgi:hypothetical protein
LGSTFCLGPEQASVSARLAIRLQCTLLLTAFIQPGQGSEKELLAAD